MACQGCDSAIEYSCGCWLDDEVVNPEGMLIYSEPECMCMWSYTHYLNPNNPRFEAEQLHKPEWLGEPNYREEPVKHPDIRWWWDNE